MANLKKSILPLIALFAISWSAWAETKPVITAISPEKGAISYSRAIKPIDAQIWAMAQGDLDGDSRVETLLAERGRIRIGHLGKKSFKEVGECSWSGIAKAAALYTIDIDGDGDDEIVISAVREGTPASMILDFEGAACKEIVSHSPWSLRVIDLPENKGRILIGQGWSRSDYFAGSIYELKLSGKKLKRVKKISLPWKTRIYQFSMLPEIDGDSIIALQKGYERLSVRKRRGRKFKRIWRSGERFGGSVNYLPAKQQVALGSEESDIVIFDIPPLPIEGETGIEFVALKSDMPLKGFVGRRPFVRGGGIYGFRRDEVFRFTESFRTKRLPGAVTDLIIARDVGDSRKRIYVVMIEDPAFFDKSNRSIIVSYDLP